MKAAREYIVPIRILKNVSSLFHQTLLISREQKCHHLVHAQDHPLPPLHHRGFGGLLISTIIAILLRQQCADHHSSVPSRSNNANTLFDTHEIHM
jgi:hypothetical protein